MANLQFNGIFLEAVSSCVPQTIRVNSDNNLFSVEEREGFIKTTGVEQFRVCASNTTTSDLGIRAAEEILDDAPELRSQIDVLIFISQTPDYLFIPSTAPIIQHKLGLNEGCLAFDVTLGCSGFTYGLNLGAAFLQNPSIRKVLIISGDTPSKTQFEGDKSVAMLFGDAASAVVLSKCDPHKVVYFSGGTDGSGANSIRIPEGGYRVPFNSTSLDLLEGKDGNFRRKIDVELDGMNVFSFGIDRAPRSVKELLQFSGFTVDDIDYFIFHQANLFMNEMIRKKLKISPDKNLMSIQKFGNTSSASIPLTIVTELGQQFSFREKNIVLCGFGVGLSWNSVLLNLGLTKIYNLVEL